MQNATGKFNATGELSFLNTWNYTLGLGAEILVPVGKQELFDSGVLHYYEYGHLYPNNGSKIIARSTTQDRMTKSAEYFLAGFFGLQWTSNATLELIIEGDGYNNSLAGSVFSLLYLPLKIPSFDLTALDMTNVTILMQPYQRAVIQLYLNGQRSTSPTQLLASRLLPRVWTSILQTCTICSLPAPTRQSVSATPSSATSSPTRNGKATSIASISTLQGMKFPSNACMIYTTDSIISNDGFQSPTGRAVGIGYVQEVLARLNHHLITSPTAQVNYTLDGMPSTFPLNQSLYFDFSHDTNIMSILTAFGFTQFAPFLPATHMVSHDLIVSHLEPFGARLDIELIEAPAPVAADRSNASGVYLEGPPTTYIHFVLNQRTLPLYKSFPACGTRDDGWCEVGTFLEVQESSYDLSQYEYACFGK